MFLLKMLRYLVFSAVKAPLGVCWARLNRDRPLSHKRMQILTSEPRCRRGGGALIVRVMPENAISGKIKWERWSERKISIFYEHFPTFFHWAFLWLSASNRIPSPLIPFSKNVITKGPLEFLLPCSLSVWAQWRSLTPSRFSVSFSDSSLLVVLSVLWEKATFGLCCPFALQVITRLSFSRKVCPHSILIFHFPSCRENQLSYLFFWVTIFFTFSL